MITFQTPEMLVLLLIPLALTLKTLSFERYRKFIGLLNILAAVSLVFAAAGPQLSLETEASPVPQVTVLQDSSESASLMQKKEFSTDEADLIYRTVDPENQDFTSQVKSITDPGSHVFFASDFQTSTQGLPSYFREKNISSNGFRAEMAEEQAVRIEGPSETVIGAENSFEAVISSSASSNATITVGLDNQTIYQGEAPYEFTRSFDENGFRKIWAEIDTGDRFEENNEYYKTIRVREKPEIASIGSEGDIEQQLEEFYSIQNFDSVPEDLDSYDAVLMKDSSSSQKLRDYIIEGGGLIYTGDDYGPSYLPVRQSERQSNTDAPLVVLLMDISQNMGCPESEKAIECNSEGDLDQDQIAMSIRLAYEITENLPENSRVSLIPYADKAYSKGIDQPRLLGTSRTEVLDDVSSIGPASAAAYHGRGLTAANTLVEGLNVESNVVMISNGKIPFSANPKRQRRIRENALSEASSLKGRLITVGVDSGFQSPPEEGEKFLRELAERSSGGFYLNGKEDDLDFNFSAGGGSSQLELLKVTDSTHFITRNYEASVSVPGVEATTVKPAASQLISTVSGKPFLMTWRYGIGKVSAFSGDNRNLDALMRKSPGLVGRTFSWTARPENRSIWIEGGREGDDFMIVSKSERENYTRKTSNRYVKDLNPEENGFYSEENLTYSKNYRAEIEEVGYDEEKMSEITVDGRVYTEDDVDEFFESIQAEESTSTETLDLRPYLLVMTLLIYLGFVGLRKRKGLA